MNRSDRIPALLILFLFLAVAGTRGQTLQPPKKSEPIEVPAENAFYAELLGSGGAYSLNYERSIFLAPPVSLRGRIGFSYFGGGLTVPALLQFSHPLLGPIRMEWGGGALFIPVTAGGGMNTDIAGVAGLRYMNASGLLLRLAYTPFFRTASEDERWIRHWGGFSVGLAF